MWSSIEIKTAPIIEPVAKSQLKDNLRLDGTDQDVMLDLLIQSCRETVESMLHRTLTTTVLQLRYDGFPTSFELPKAPVQSVDSIQYYDDDNVLQTLSTDVYDVDLNSIFPRILLANEQSFPSTYDRPASVLVEYTAGYGDLAEDVPAAIRQAILMLASDIYEHPEANVELKLTENKTLGHLLAAYHVPWLGGDRK